MYPQAYIDYLVHFHGDRDYFECHEVLEEHWKEDPPAARKDYWVGLIQIAVALYHQRRSNMTGAARMMKSAISLIERKKAHIASLGLDAEALVSLLRERLADLHKGVPYTSMQLPIADQALEEICKKHCEENGMVWRSDSDLTNENLLHRHTRRDRSDVIAERRHALQQKRQRP